MRASFLLVLAFLAFASPALRAAQRSSITIRVEQVTGNESDKSRHTQKRSLRVYVANGGTADASGLVVKYFHFGRDLKDRDASVVDKGEKGVSVKSHATEVVETPAATSVYTEEHGQREGGRKNDNAKSNRGNRSGQNVRYKKVEASGTKLTGYAVQVYSGTSLVAEYYSEPSLKEKLR
jgi:hypothetical protein